MIVNLKESRSMIIFMKKHQLLSYFLLAFLWSWAWWLSLIFTAPAEDILSGDMSFSFIFSALMGGLGPSIAGLAVARITEGRKNIRSMFSFKKGLSGKWLIAAFLTVPLITVVQVFVQYLTGRIISYDIVPLMLVMGFIWPCFSSFGEEIGWRGFALPILLKRTNAVKASLLIGLIWGFWHMPADFIAYASYGWLFFPMFAMIGLVTLTAHSVIMTYIYLKTKGNLLIMVIYHFTITATSILAPSFAFSDHADDIAKTAVSVAVLCVPVLYVLLFSKIKTMNRVEQS
jgi:uncharacterized protein